MLTAIIVAGGSSRRMGSDKLFIAIAGKPVIAHAIGAFEKANSVSAIIVVAREDRHRDLEKLVRDQNWKKIQSVVAGGERSRTRSPTRSNAPMSILLSANQWIDINFLQCRHHRFLRANC